MGLVATSGAPDVARLAEAVAVLTGWGLVPVLGRHIVDRHPRAVYLAGTDADRASDLQEAWCDDSLQAVFVVRGGYGAVRLLDLLDPAALRYARPKLLIGSSDVTAVHEYWAEKLGLATWFTPMIATAAFLDDASARKSLHEALFVPFHGRVLGRSDAVTLVPGTVTGRLTGGNLSLLSMTIGARGRPESSTVGRIGMLEDVGEPVYKIDALLHSLLRSGWFDGLAGLALGSWTDCGGSGEVRALVDELLVPLGVPLVWELGFGHGLAALSVPLGVTATLHADSTPRLELCSR